MLYVLIKSVYVESMPVMSNDVTMKFRMLIARTDTITVVYICLEIAQDGFHHV